MIRKRPPLQVGKEISHQVITSTGAKVKISEKVACLLILGEDHTGEKIYCIGSVNWKAPIVEEVFSNHWHNHVSIVVVMQYPNTPQGQLSML